MSNVKKLMMTAAGGGGLNVEDVFSTYLFNFASAPYTVTNGIDLSGEGGLVWIRGRTSNNHWLHDSERTLSNALFSNLSDAEYSTANSVTSLNNNGFTVGGIHSGSVDNASWTFRKAPKFFDVVTYNGNSSTNVINHNLGSTPGCMFIKCTSSSAPSGTTSQWMVYHRGLSSPTAQALYLNTASQAQGYGTGLFGVNDTTFTLNNTNETNDTGNSYVAYLFAHNDGDGDFGPTGDQDIIKCGNYTGTGQAGLEIDLGFEPQWVLIKHADGGQYWNLFDTMRGIGDGTNDPRIWPNDSGAENQTLNALKVTPTGFIIEDTGAQTNNNTTNYIYIAIRRGPMATPEDATDVFDMHTGSAYQVRFDTTVSEVDLAVTKELGSGGPSYVGARIQGGNWLRFNSTDPEGTSEHGLFDSSDQYAQKQGGTNMFTWMWKRAPGYFDCVTYEGVPTTVKHNLGVAPEMIWIKRKNVNYDWQGGINLDGDIANLSLNSSSSLYVDTSTTWASQVSSTDFTRAKIARRYNGGASTASDDKCIAYLFASLAGVSKVGSFTYSGSAVNVDCGFSSGARFVMLKAVNAAGNWLVFDTENGINAGNDPFLQWDNTSGPDSNYDVIDPYSAGFTAAGALSNAEYIFYAIA